MKTPSSNTAVYTDFHGLARLKTKAQQPDEATLREVARQFESMFFEMVIQGMREAKLGDGMFDSQEGEMYYDLFDKQLSLELTRQQGIGLGDQLVRQLKGTLRSEIQNSEPSPALASTHHVGVVRGLNPVTETARAPAAPDWRPADKAEFVRDVWPYAKQAGETLGVPAETLVAQAALESGWGRGMLRTADGRPSFNIFNIKADTTWQGERVAVAALEHEQGVLRKVPSLFRSYDDLESAFSDYVAFVRGNPRYTDALRVAGNGREYLTELHRAGYATDPQYVQKITGILDSPGFSETLAQSREAPDSQTETIKTSFAEPSR